MRIDCTWLASDYCSYTCIWHVMGLFVPHVVSPHCTERERRLYTGIDLAAPLEAVTLLDHMCLSIILEVENGNAPVSYSAHQLISVCVFMVHPAVEQI